MFHNYSAINRSYDFFIADARTGIQQGVWSMIALANTTYQIPMSAFETGIGWVPTASQGHANITVFPSEATPENPTPDYYGYAGQMIYNQALQAYINMSQICRLAH
jgi:hypothetical protein